MDAPTLRIWGQIVVGSLSMLIFVGVLVTAVTLKDATLINTMAGYAAGFASAVVMFYFGSSAGSQAKDEKIPPLERAP